MQSIGTRTDDTQVFELSRQEIDELPFGLITLDRSGMILRYNRAEETLAHRSSIRTVGLSFFNDVAPCTNVQAFRGRFDAFAQQFDSGVERFAFAFAFRWGRQDVTITMLRKAGHDDINILVRGRSTGSAGDAEPVTKTPAIASHVQSAEAVESLTFFDARELTRPVVCVLDATDPMALHQRVHPDDAPMVGAIIAAAARDRTTYGVQYRGASTVAGRRIFEERGYFDADRKRASYATIVDVTAERQFENETWRAAHYDLLTGLPNQKTLLLRIVDAIRETERNGRLAAVLMANVNHFRNVNNTFGYEKGDAVLRAVALRLGECVRGGDTVARIAADTFAVLLTDMDSQQSVDDNATRLIAAVALPFMVEDRPYHLALRVGISLVPYDGRDPVRLLNAAETAIFAAKAAGRSGISFYSGQFAVDAVSALQQQNELRSALENGEFELLYQPLVDIVNNRVIAAEALVRWNHPTRGLVSPLEFIPLADRTGLIVPLGEWVMRTACRQVRVWIDGGADVRVCINVSTVQFQRPDFVDLVASIVAEFDLTPGRLELEVTESIMVAGFGEMMETLTRLKALGVRLAIDDFGTGYSSLSYLKYFPVDTLKIDRAFITDIVSDDFDHAISTAVVTLTKNLALECVAEGVETAEQLQQLVKMGCNIVQGYYFSKPTTPETLTGLLSAPLTPAELRVPTQR